ncbi:hypothetical protein ANN_07600 [Periplaneta americana]|uniref:Uncharacterized protein n=1 Tax=Periplaneta americana TaxID=6978 RepID=A0ABQ8T0A3_PERAM|nr:hypothetical protein ANN_07600 [Periplaneta americana]
MEWNKPLKILKKGGVDWKEKRLFSNLDMKQRIKVKFRIREEMSNRSRIGEEQKLRVYENKVLRKTFGAKRDEVTGEWRKLHNAERHALYSSSDIIKNIKSRRSRWAGHVARMSELLVELHSIGPCFWRCIVIQQDHPPHMAKHATIIIELPVVVYTVLKTRSGSPGPESQSLLGHWCSAVVNVMVSVASDGKPTTYVQTLRHKSPTMCYYGTGVH